MAMGTLVHRDPFFTLPRGLGLRRAATVTNFSPSVDAVETGEEYRVVAELPGLSESDFAVEIEDGVLTLRGEKKAPHAGDSEEDTGAWRLETRRGKFQRRLRFGHDVDETAVKAIFSNGVLDVRVPKRAEARPEVRTIPVETS
jgi:HSP20 family protein